jgi:hypothetical protein
MKKTLSVLLICCFILIGSSCSSQKPPATNHITATTIVYWVPSGHVYHVDKDCPTLRRSKTIESGTPAQAKADGKSRLCEVCGDGYIDDTNS